MRDENTRAAFRSTSANVLICGAGPVGLTLALELARRGVRFRIIDRLASPLPYCRAIGVSPRTLEVWDDMGIASSMIDAGLWLRGTRSVTSNSEPRDAYTDWSDLPYGALGVPQPETERILTEHLARFASEVERSTTLESIVQDDAGVEVRLRHEYTGPESVRFEYVIGCDGAHSAVRQLTEIAFEGDQFPVSFMLGDVLIDLDLPRGLMLRAVNPDPEGGVPDFLVAIPLPEQNRYRVSMLAPPGSSDGTGPAHGLQGQRGAPALADLQCVADRLLPQKVVLSDLRWSSLFRISMKLAAHYRSGRAFLAGDAAHIHPPTGGQGMNTGIQDAYNLGWKLALVVKGEAHPDLLDTYEAERRPVGSDVVSRTRKDSEQFGKERAETRNRLADTQILVNYRGLDWFKDEGPELKENLPVCSGDRAPDCVGLSRENIGYSLRLFDLTRGTEFVLVVYIAPEEGGAAQTRFLQELSRMGKFLPDFSCRLLLICSPGMAKPDIQGLTAVTDTQDAFAAAYKPGIRTAFLIRPDGYLAYQARPITVGKLKDYLQSAGLSAAVPEDITFNAKANEGLAGADSYSSNVATI